MRTIDGAVTGAMYATVAMRPAGVATLALALALAVAPAPLLAQEIGWRANGGDAYGTRYSPAKVITRENVARLEVAWTYRTGEADPRFATAEPPSFEATPLVDEGTMYVGTPLGRVIALDAATGRELWVFDPEIRRDIRYGDFASRGVSFWIDPGAAPGAACRRTIFVATAQSQLFALDAADGRPCEAFGDGGSVDLTEGLRIPPFERAAYTVTSPPVVVNGLVITGSSIGDNTQPDLPSGEVRAFDARTGALVWSWDPIPQDPADPAYDEWGGALAHGTGGANAWSILVADPERDLVFVPTGSAAPDYYGGLRLGDNRYANSIVALRASTGELVWAFQTVHHDLWDYDNAAPPALVTIRRGGREIPAVLQATKTGMLFVLHRETGEPLFPVEERPVPASRVPTEAASPTQPFTTAIAPLSPHTFSVDDVWGVSEEDRAACRAAIAPLRNEGIFTPPDTRGTLVLPSNLGGAHWGGLAWDPERRIAVIPVNHVAAEVQLIPRDSIDFEKARENSERLMPAGQSAQPEWGSVNLGGPIATAGGVVFIGAALDRALKAYDIETGRELWRGPLPESGKATPMTYRLDSGEQFVAIAVGGGEVFGAGDYVVAFRLPR